jgi:hypothetical protein
MSFDNLNARTYILTDAVPGLLKYGRAWFAAGWPLMHGAPGESAWHVAAEGGYCVPLTSKAGTALLLDWLIEVGGHDCCWARPYPAALRACVMAVSDGREPPIGYFEAWEDGANYGSPHRRWRKGGPHLVHTMWHEPADEQPYGWGGQWYATEADLCAAVEADGYVLL